MDQKAAYEITIAEKLEQLSVPDMVDAIWARIETQLDIDMPPDDGPAPDSNPPAGGSFRGFAGLAVFIAALLGIIYFTTKKKPTNNTGNTIDNSPTIITSPGTDIDKPPPLPGSQTPRSSNLPGQNALPVPQVEADSSSNTVIDQPVTVPANRIDSIAVAPPIVITPIESTKKKGSGVKGITDNDYRIVPERKDST